MAASTRALTPTGPFTPTSAAPNTPTSTLLPNPTSGLRASPSKSPHTLSPRLSPQPLTGAAVMAEERRVREQKQREEAQATSPNPAVTALNALISSDAQMSQRKDGGPAAVAQMSEPLQKVAKSIVIPENSITSDNMQTSPVSLSSFGSVDNTTHAPTATAMDTTAPPQFPIDNIPGQTRAQVEQAAQSTGGHENAANRSMTFPGPLNPDQDPRAPQRGMSLPMSGYAQNNPKSPNTKRHKCPYCSTDFTRHHNLKSHLLTHSQEKPYECPDCHARFRRLHDLKRHTKLHTGERPHICPKCGRRFARGDALARHNKGQGGCAGRRSSFGIDEDMSELRDGDAMDGLEYSHASPGDEQHDNAASTTPRRISEPSRRASGRQHSTSSTTGYTTSQHGSTYPPVVAAGRTPNSTNNSSTNNSLRPLYPPSGTSTRDTSMANTTSPKAGVPSLSSVHFNAAASGGVYSPHGGMTESPKPLSPGQPVNADHLLPGSRSPNLSHPAMNPASFSRAGMLPPSGASANAPQLPQLPGLGPASTTDPRLVAAKPASSNPSSLSSHGGASAASGGSGGSMRELLARNTPGAATAQGSGESALGGGADVWNYIRELEQRNAAREREYEARIAGLEREVRGLRGELSQQQGVGAQQTQQAQTQQGQQEGLAQQLQQQQQQQQQQQNAVQAEGVQAAR